MLSQKAILVYLGISQWTGRKLDRKATGSVEATFATDGKVGQYTKKLLPGAKELEAIKSQEGSIRKFYYDNTLPWMTDGSRILSSKNYLDFIQEFRSRKNAFDSSVEAFLLVYPTLRESAKAKLGELFNESDYPSEIRLRESFQCEVSFLPLPEVSDFRTEILDSEKDAFLKNMKSVEEKATRDCFERLHSVVSKAAQKLTQPDAIFRDTLIDNITELCGLLPKLNVTDNPDLEKSRLEVEALVSKISPDLCRVNQTERTDAAQKLNEITAKMSSFMGVA